MQPAHARELMFGKRLSILTWRGQRYFVGVQVANLLKRETFNMYRSMKIKVIGLKRASPEQVEFLVKEKAVRSGTHSITLIPYDDGIYFIADAYTKLLRNGSQKNKLRGVKLKRSFIKERPKIARRKPAPWNIHRSIKQEDKHLPLQLIQAKRQGARIRNATTAEPTSFPVTTPTVVVPTTVDVPVLPETPKSLTGLSLLIHATKSLGQVRRKVETPVLAEDVKTLSPNTAAPNLKKRRSTPGADTSDSALDVDSLTSSPPSAMANPKRAVSYGLPSIQEALGHYVSPFAHPVVTHQPHKNVALYPLNSISC
eukprot:TRINITY_DN10637_c0_g1_i2.p1 TRINITY_DN10637_c0_g1~~TRINITY_DN10637_c0_g1_i2.p1  ORF type:complete len:312 (-),score=24.97 TRINITY_DN10637_c0_g1_i2:117-1052(-)